jgi:hypothetical protein
VYPAWFFVYNDMEIKILSAVKTQKGMDYQFYKGILKSKKWRGKAWRLKKKGFCFVCGIRENLVIHHLNYQSVGKEKDKDLVVLCQEHHHGLHFPKSGFRKFCGWNQLKQYKDNVMFNDPPYLYQYAAQVNRH